MTRDFLDIYLPTQVGKSLIPQRHTGMHSQFSVVICMNSCIFNRQIPIRRLYTRNWFWIFFAFLEQNGAGAWHLQPAPDRVKAYVWYASDDDISLQPTALSISRVPPRRNQKKEKPVLSEDDTRHNPLAAPKQHNWSA